MATHEEPAWARGYDLEELRAVAQVFRAADKPYALGAFSAVKENTVAEWRAAGQLLLGTDYAAAQLRPKVTVPVRDFTGEARARIEPGAIVFRRVAASSEAGWRALAGMVREEARARPVWLEGWVESPAVQRLTMEARLHLVATKIKASSELVGVWSSEPPTAQAALHPADERTLVRLLMPDLPLEVVEAAAAQVVGTTGWADHYSSYNQRHSWSALALQGYHAPGAEPDATQIAKPAEMSKAWKAEHFDWESWPVGPTPLMEVLPAVAGLVRHVAYQLATTFQRVRLMRLEPGGGELTRHSDITDPEAGTASGKLARLHFPLATNPDVRFRQWRLSGRQVEAHMAVGEGWYLDTRKPHRAGNFGTEPRIHLVIDAYSSATLRRLIAEGNEAPEVLG